MKKDEERKARYARFFSSNEIKNLAEEREIERKRQREKRLIFV